MKRLHDELARLGRWMVGTFVLAMVLVLMSACGGGDWEEEDATKSTNPPDCKAHPELCQ